MTIDVPAKTFATASVTREMSGALLAAAMKAAEQIGIGAAIAVTDATGALKAFARADNAPFLTADIAIAKAWTSASTGYPTHVWNDIVQDPKNAPLAHFPKMMAAAGGYPLLDDGKLVGGIGVSGGNHQQDIDIAEAALKACDFTLPA